MSVLDKMSPTGGDACAWSLPVILACSSAVVFLMPDRGLAVLLALVGIILSPLSAQLSFPAWLRLPSWWKSTAAKLTAELWANAFLEFSRDKVLSETVLDAASEAMCRALTDKKVTSAMKTSMIDSMDDACFQKQLLGVLTKATVAASEDEQLRKAGLQIAKGALAEALADSHFLSSMVEALTKAALLSSKNGEIRDEALSVMKEAVSLALKDQDFMQDMCETFSNAAIVASRNADLRHALVGVTKDGVADALRDSGFVNVFRDALCDCLQAPNIYRSAASGVIGSLNPFNRREKQPPAM